MSNLSDRLRELRKSKGITQKALAHAIGMSTSGIQNYELKTRIPNVEVLIKLADYFDVSVDYLIGRSDNPARL